MLTYDNIIFYEPEKSTTTDEIRYSNIKERAQRGSFLYIADENNEKISLKINKVNYKTQQNTVFPIENNDNDNTSRITHQNTQSNNNVKFSKKFLRKIVMISSNISDRLVMIWSSLRVVGACVMGLIIDITLLLIRIRKAYRMINKILHT